jgi:hypothetical protein
VDDLGISARELRALLRVSNRSAPAAKEHGERLDDVIAAVHALLPFKHCVVVHERLGQSQTLAFSYARTRGFSKRVGAARQDDPSLRIDQYLQGLSRFGMFQNAFFWFRKGQAATADHASAAGAWGKHWTEGIAGSINTAGAQPNEPATLVLLQYSQEQFAAKHLVFANLIAGCLHTYFAQGEALITKVPRAVAGWLGAEGMWQMGPAVPAGRPH